MMLRRLLIILAVTVVAAVSVPQALAARPPQVKATFGTGLTFDVKKGKKLVSSGASGSIKLKRGAYRFVLKDDEASHNYRLVNAKGKTITGKVGRKTRKVVTGVAANRAKPYTYVARLRKGTYTLICDPHRSLGMTVTIKVK